MFEVREYNLATGHTECLTTVVDSAEAKRYINQHLAGDKSADHVVYIHDGNQEVRQE